jgi:biopolymer transport protein ExbD
MAEESVMAMNVSRSGGDQATCEVNTTPLIDVMLVLLVMLIVTLPTQTHLIQLNMPVSSPPAPPPPAILIDIDSDGTIVWNNESLGGIGALEAHFREESTKVPQAQVRLRPSALAKYDVIAKVMASAQRNNMTRMGFSNVAEYAE